MWLPATTLPATTLARRPLAKARHQAKSSLPFSFRDVTWMPSFSLILGHRPRWTRIFVLLTSLTRGFGHSALFLLQHLPLRQFSQPFFCFSPGNGAAQVVGRERAPGGDALVSNQHVSLPFDDIAVSCGFSRPYSPRIGYHVARLSITGWLGIPRSFTGRDGTGDRR